MPDALYRAEVNAMRRFKGIKEAHTLEVFILCSRISIDIKWDKSPSSSQVSNRIKLHEALERDRCWELPAVASRSTYPVT